MGAHTTPILPSLHKLGAHLSQSPGTWSYKMVCVYTPRPCEAQ